MSDHARLRKALLKQLYVHTEGDLAREVRLSELRDALKIPQDYAGVIVGQLVGKGWMKVIHKPLTADSGPWTVAITMQGVEEIEKMERGWLRSLYEDHFAVYSAIWTIAVIAIGVLLNVGARHLLEGDRTPPPIIVNVPEQKPPIVNIVIPEPKAKVP